MTQKEKGKKKERSKMVDLWDLVDFTATSHLGLPPAGQEDKLSQLPPPVAPLII